MAYAIASNCVIFVDGPLSMLALHASICRIWYFRRLRRKISLIAFVVLVPVIGIVILLALIIRSTWKIRAERKSMEAELPGLPVARAIPEQSRLEKRL